ncbi:MAG: universal stress protein [Alphaproteobacteria bacterium]|nr:universal stress protein [Alphaproteobacteria bacterium]
MAKQVKYIVGYDGGELSVRAAELAVEKLQVRGGGVLLLVYVVDWSEFEVMSVEELAVRHSQHIEQLESAEQDVMAPARAKLAAENIIIETYIQMGHAAEIISALAEEHKADQIFIGHKSSGFLAKLGLGSVAYSILQKAKIPVTVVP